MDDHRRLPIRERVFAHSLMYHGFRFVRRRDRLKKNRGYVIPATKAEDSSLIDFWVKLPGDTKLIPVQITQRGTAIFRTRNNPSPPRFQEFELYSRNRLRRKRTACAHSRVAFVMVQDHLGERTNPQLAWKDKKALFFGLVALAA
jgi:hypothetical protein